MLWSVKAIPLIYVGRASACGGLQSASRSSRAKALRRLSRNSLVKFTRYV